MMSDQHEPVPQSAQDAAPHDDTLLPPWAQPSPEAKAEAEPAKEALKEALQAVKTPAQAERVADDVLATASGVSAEQVREQGDTAAQPAQAVQAAATTPGVEKAPATLVEAAKQVAGSSGEKREALEQALKEATNPDQGDVEPSLQEPLDLVRAALLRRMKPLQAVDARLFLAINHLPHPPLLNSFMYAITIVMTGGWGWVLGLVAATIANKRRGLHALHQVVPPLWFATMTVEYPIKYYFRRKRPFIDIVQAIAVGKKPGSYSFPSGHSAAAFAGAWLLRRQYPKLTALWYVIAALIGFSRVYLGAHYPGDVVSGALSGTVIAEATRWVIESADEPVETHPTARLLRKLF
jgi:membrane-associated phospholipid phosphatase